MADLRNQLAEIYVKVVADTKESEKRARAIAKTEKETAEAQRKRAESAKKVQEEVARSGDKISKKQLKDILKRAGIEEVFNAEQIKMMEDMAKRKEKDAKFSEKVADRRKRKHELVEAHIMNLMTRFRDYSGRLDDEELKLNKSRNAQKLANYESFLKRASHEHSRFATRLDQRDMTASTLENMRRGFEKGILISNKWHKDENTLQRMSRSIGIMGSALNRTKNDSEMAASAFASLQRVSYNLQALFGVLGGSIGSLGGGLLSLIGVAGQAAYSLIAVGSAFASMGAGMIAARVALGGVGKAVSAMLDPQKKLQGALRNTRRELRNLRFDAEEAALSQEEAAINLEKAREELARVQDLPPDSRVRRETELQFQQAELNYRRAKARNKEAREDLKKGPAGSGTVDPLAALTKSQKAFAKYLVTLKPLMDQLKEAAASGFLPILQTSIQTLVDKAFPTLQSGLNILGTAMGNASKSFADAFTMPRTLEQLDSFFKSSKPVIETFGRALGNAFSGLLGALKSAQPLTDRFVKWVDTLSVRFQMWGNSSGLKSFLNLSGEVASRLGKTFSTVFGGLKNVLDATFPGGNINAGAGGVLLSWLQKLADGFKSFTGNTQFASWLKATTQNATTMLSSIGTLLKPLFDIAAMPEIGEFWTVLKGAAEPIKKMLEDGAKAGPEFAAMLVSIVKMFAQFSDSGALEAFFNTLNQIATVITEYILKPLKPVLDFWGRIHGALLAVGLAIIVAKTTLMVMAGIVGNVFGAIGKTSAAMTKFAVVTTTATLRYKGLRKEGLSAGAAVKGVSDQFVKTVRQAQATRRAALLVQMARDAGMSAAKLKQLEKQLDQVIMKQGIYSRSGMIGAVQGQTTKAGKPTALAQDPALAAAGKVGGSRFAGGRAAVGLGGGALALGSMAGTGGSALTTGLGMASMVASFLPGPLGLISGAVLGIGSAISSGFDAAAQAEKEKKDAEKQKKIQIEAARVDLQAENVNQLKGATQTLVGAGAKATDVQDIINTGVDNLKDQRIQGISDYQATFRGILDAGFADVFAGNNESLKKSLIGAVGTVSKSGLYSPEEAAQLLDPIFDAAGGGKAGLAAVNKYIKSKKFADVGLYTSTSGTEGELLARQEAQRRTRDDFIAKNREKSKETYGPGVSALKKAIGDLDTDILGLRGNIESDQILKILGFEGKRKEFNQKFYSSSGSLDRERLRPVLETALSKQETLASGGSTGVPFGPGIDAKGNSMINNRSFFRGTNRTNSGIPTPGFTIPSVSGVTANAAPTGPKGTAAEPINVTDPSLKGLGPAITKLANATPNVMVVNVKNKSELDALYRKLGLPSIT